MKTLKFPRSVVFGPLEYGGVVWESMETVQIYEHINLYLHHVKKNDEMAKLINITQDTEQFIQGMSTPIMEVNKIPTYVEDSLITSLQRLLIKNKMKISTYKQWVPQPKRKNNIVLIDYLKTKIFTITICSISITVDYIYK